MRLIAFLLAAAGLAWLTGSLIAAQNPPFYLDYADIDTFKVDGIYYLSASSMHMSPGAPLLCSSNLVHWEAVGASVPSLMSLNPRLAMQGGTAYVQGIYASTARYRKSNKTWYWYGCINGVGRTFVYTSHSPQGPWIQAATIAECLYDVGLAIDNKDTMYVAYGHGPPITVAQLSSDGFQIVNKNAQAVTSFPRSPDGGSMIEGSRMYFIEGNYYVLNAHPARSEYVSKASNPMGPYQTKVLFDGISGPLPGGGNPHQGGFVDLLDGSKPTMYAGFQDAYPAGRVPVFAPVSWSSDGWPTVQLAGSSWPQNYANVTEGATQSCSGRSLGQGQGFLTTGSDTFQQSSLHPSWEWNHDPDDTKWSLGAQGLTLKTVTVTTDLYNARNTLCRRIPGPKSSMVVTLDVSQMTDGDRAGLAAFRESAAYIGVEQTGFTRSIVAVSGLRLGRGGGGWSSQSPGTTSARETLSSTTVNLRIDADVIPRGATTASFSYSTNGSAFTSLGPALRLSTDWPFFLGYQYCLFHHATKAEGGATTVRSAVVQASEGAQRYTNKQ